ncbi:MAG TPA: hypothetical protein VF592_03535 [Sphingomonas sp.]|jgi:hypothetical protein|uniref:hypothetical protein n=1 Tax=Sphingomonas sp. TaxID=28214 RepID=UPI002EDB1941
MSGESRLAQDVAERQTAMFASFVGQGRYTTRAALAAASRIPESTLRSYAGGAAMPLHAVLALRPHLPGQAINMLTEPGGYRLVEVETSDTNWDVIAAGAAGLTFEICDARKDGVVDHVERARLRTRARGLIAELSDVIGDE